MGQNSGIEWTDHTFNPWIGCTKVSPGCEHCYAETYAKRYGKDVWRTGKPRQLTSDHNWNEQLRWNASARKAGTRSRVFCASLADMFDNEIAPKWRARLWSLIGATPHLDWLLLTKRVGNIAKMLPQDWGQGYANVWLGISVVNQEEADRDIPKLLDISARVRFLSVEPMIGPIDLVPLRVRHEGQHASIYPLTGVFQIPSSHYNVMHPRIHWVIVGGESGPGARPINPHWVRMLQNQCATERVPFFFKQWGEWMESGDAFRADIIGAESKFPWGVMQPLMTWVGKKKAGRTLDGKTYSELPEVRHAA